MLRSHQECFGSLSPSPLRHPGTPSVQPRASNNLALANLDFSRLSGRPVLPLSRGLECIETILHDFELKWGSSAGPDGPGPSAADVSVAMLVDPERVKAPESAGVLCPSEVLPGPLRSVYLDTATRVRPIWEHDDVQKLCYKVDSVAEIVLRG